SGSTNQQYKKGEQDNEKDKASAAPPEDSRLASAAIFFKLSPAPSLRTLFGSASAVQIGASIALNDNETGEQISSSICRIIAGPVTTEGKEALSRLNRLLAR